MPSLSPTMSQGNIATWHKKEGDRVKPGDVLADIETDKATLAFEMTDEGYLAKILVPAGTKDIAVNTPVAILVEEESELAAFKDYKAPAAGAAPAAAAAPSSSPSASSPSKKAPAAAATAPVVPVSAMKIGPKVRYMMNEAGAPLALLVPSGPRNFVLLEDALDAIARHKKGDKAPAAAAAAPAAPAAAPKPAVAPAAAPAAKAPPPPPSPAAAAPASGSGSGYTDVPNNNIRRVIAKRLLESKVTIPHLYLSRDVALEGVTDLRRTLKAGECIIVLHTLCSTHGDCGCIALRETLLPG
jgi:pyruvate dehydrogenase E2 component (dihydrolipoamide acetyltransferase)